jgi:myo-inositol 2-dehydrogenase/D-chiro-inositol 1-dehydrogenase
MTIRIGLIGTGIMGADHAHTIVTGVGGAELVAIHDADRERAQTVARACGAAIRVTTTADELIADRAVDAVLVASPDETHASLAIACIEAGKPVLVEKPLASTLDECRAVISAEMKSGRRLVQVGFMRRFDPGYLAMKDVVAQNRLGAPLFFHCVHRNAGAADYMTSELVIANSAVHEMDIARFLLAEEFASAMVISPRPSRNAPKRQPQLIVLETRSGVVIDVEAFVDATYGYDVRGELVCEEGSVTLTPGSAVTTRAAGQHASPIEADWRARFNTAYRDQIAAWVDSVGGGEPRGASAWDGYAASVTAAACLEAWRTRTKVEVKVDEAPELYR